MSTRKLRLFQREGGKDLQEEISSHEIDEPRPFLITRMVTFIYDAGPHRLENLRLKGSWNISGEYSSSWSEGVTMRSDGDNCWKAEIRIMDDGVPHDWEWGVVADGPLGRQMWAIMGEGNLKFDLRAEKMTFNYAPTTYHRMGAHRVGQGDIRFCVWAPNASAVVVKVALRDGGNARLPMVSGLDGEWTCEAENGWSSFSGCPYLFELVDSAGRTVERVDPYARVVQGTQRGIGRFQIDATNGKETHYLTPTQLHHILMAGLRGDRILRAMAYQPEATGAVEVKLRESGLLGIPNRIDFLRFEIQANTEATQAELVLEDEVGRKLNKSDLVARLGLVGPSLIMSARNNEFNDLWSENVLEDGTISLVDVGGAFSIVVNNPEALVGLHYNFRAFRRDGSGKRVIWESTSEFNDPWSNLISINSGISFRDALITAPTYVFRYDDVQREREPEKWVIYQLHVGSFLGHSCNVKWSTFRELTSRLTYFKSIGVTTLQLMPTSQSEWNRDWGYMGANTLAANAAFGFADSDGTWVSGDEALRRFIDQAHMCGLNVVNDVVYNHISGYYEHLWEWDGPQNSYFNWSNDPTQVELRKTPWGFMPAFSNQKVRQFIVDHALAQIEDYHFDGLRFDVVDAIKDIGGVSGREALREINRQIHFFQPRAWTVAEQYDDDASTTRPAERGDAGLGFDARYFVDFQHRLVNGDASSLLDCAARGRFTNMDAFMDLLVNNPRGIAWSKAIAIVSNHDEVGNALRTIAVASGGTACAFPSQWARSAARFVVCIGLMSPGIPMFFSGEESLAQNSFKWANPSTWDIGWKWESQWKDLNLQSVVFNDWQRALYGRLLEIPTSAWPRDPDYLRLTLADRKVLEFLEAMGRDEREKAMLNLCRKQMVEFFRDATSLRTSSPALCASGGVTRLYTHNEHSVIAFSRHSGADEFVVVGSLNRNDLWNYAIPLSAGTWEQVLNTDALRYGGNGFGENGVVPAGARIVIPAGGCLVLKRIG